MPRPAPKGSLDKIGKGPVNTSGILYLMWLLIAITGVLLFKLG